jgi:hypothetical protein
MGNGGRRLCGIDECRRERFTQELADAVVAVEERFDPLADVVDRASRFQRRQSWRLSGHVVERGPIERQDLGFAAGTLHAFVEALSGFLADESLGEHLLDESGHRKRGACIGRRAAADSDRE